MKTTKIELPRIRVKIINCLHPDLYWYYNCIGQEFEVFFDPRHPAYIIADSIDKQTVLSPILSILKTDCKIMCND